jgi:paraquat-inducible protein B
MSSHKNTSLLIGAFLVGVAVLVFTALLFFSDGQMFSSQKRVVMYYQGSVQGLQIGAPIKLKGVVLGEIVDIQINFENDNQPVMTAVTGDLVLSQISQKGTEVDDTFLMESINNGLRAQLNYQSILTGQLYVELDFFPDTLITLYKLQDDFLELPTVATDFEKISKDLQALNVQGLASSFESLIFKVNKFVASGKIEETFDSINSAAKSVDKAALNLDSEFVELSKNLNATSIELSHLLKTLNQKAPEMTKQLNQNLVVLQKSLDQFNRTAQTLNHTFSEDAPLVYQLNTTLQDISESAKAFRILSETIEQQPEAIWRGKQ